jgi:hypothetical protein
MLTSPSNLKRNSQPPSSENERLNRSRDSSEGPPSDYYYDDATGYEIYQDEEEEDEDSEPREPTE